MECFENQKIKNVKVSEKYDGVQGVWDGQTLKSRAGNRIDAPGWWVKLNLPTGEAKGELWAGRGQFEKVLSVIKSGGQGDWRSIRFKNFNKIEQIKIRNRKDLYLFYRNILDNGGEGVVITLKNGEQIKMKPTTDDDGLLVGFGENKKGDIVSLVLRLRSGKTLKVAGLNYRIKKSLPKIGTVIKFKFNGVTAKGTPRHARFDSIRYESSLKFGGHYEKGKN